MMVAQCLSFGSDAETEQSPYGAPADSLVVRNFCRRDRERPPEATRGFWAEITGPHSLAPGQGRVV
jgi:hypothetical protein